jgi:hypothetical protein
MWHKHTCGSPKRAPHNEIFICSCDFEVTYIYDLRCAMALFHLLRSITYPTQGCKLPCQYCALCRQGGAVAMEFLSCSRKMRLLIYTDLCRDIHDLYLLFQTMQFRSPSRCPAEGRAAFLDQTQHRFSRRVQKEGLV